MLAAPATDDSEDCVGGGEAQNAAASGLAMSPRTLTDADRSSMPTVEVTAFLLGFAVKALALAKVAAYWAHSATFTLDFADSPWQNVWMSLKASKYCTLLQYTGRVHGNPIQVLQKSGLYSQLPAKSCAR